jgi:hypothetical protein
VKVELPISVSGLGDGRAKADSPSRFCAKSVPEPEPIADRGVTRERGFRIPAHLLLQPGVLGLSLLQNGGVEVRVFPECEELFVRGERPDAGRIGIRSL